MEVMLVSTAEMKGQDHQGAFVGEGEEDPEEGRESLSGEVVATRGELHPGDLVWFSSLNGPPFYGSSVKAVDKREGAGAHNWGTMKDDIETYDFLVTASDSFISSACQSNIDAHVSHTIRTVSLNVCKAFNCPAC